MNKVDRDIANLPDTTVSVKEKFGFDSKMVVPAYSAADRACAGLRSGLSVRPADHARHPAGFAYNRRVMVSGYHGTGKSTHIEQVAARLNWPCVRVNLDSHVSRIDLVGKDAIVVKDGMQVTEFRDGILPWAYQHNVALVLRRIRCRPPGRDVRHPARAGIVGPPDPARPEPRHPPASGLPPVRHRQHGRPRRHDRPLSRHAADQPGADGPLVDRHHAELPAARQRGRHRAGQGQALPRRQGHATSSTRWCASPT